MYVLCPVEVSVRLVMIKRTAVIPQRVSVTEKFLMEKPNYNLPDTKEHEFSISLSLPVYKMYLVELSAGGEPFAAFCALLDVPYGTQKLADRSYVFI